MDITIYIQGTKHCNYSRSKNRLSSVLVAFFIRNLVIYAAVIS